ncbi:MAG TPA: hypothetical protein VD833_22455 [Vicinamibacterales bacterium]|nr:hypothetical protein [Vicinamibacterales bacterium]
MGASLEARAPVLLAMGDLLRDQRHEEILTGPALALGPLHQVAPARRALASDKRFEKAIEIVTRGNHDRPPTRRDDTGVLGRVQYQNGTEEIVHFFAARLRYSRSAEVTLVADEQVESLVQMRTRSRER